jgi:hypothetical protein
MEQQVLITDGSSAGQFASESEVIKLSLEFYDSIEHDGKHYPPSAHVDDAVELCEHSAHCDGVLTEDAIETVDGWAHFDESCIEDVTEYHILPILDSRRGTYDMVRLYDGEWAYRYDDHVYHGYVDHRSNTGYFYDRHDDRVQDRDDNYYRTSGVASDMGLSYQDDLGCYGYEPDKPEYLCGYGDAPTRDHSDGAKVKFGIEVEKEDRDVLESIYHDTLFDDTDWAKECDGSLDKSEGYELVSPIYDLMNLTKFYKALEHDDIARHINACYSDSCGGHITISSDGYTASELYEGMTGFFPLIYGLYPKRTKKSYCEAKCKRHMAMSPTKYSAFYIKNGMLESRIFPAFRDVNNVKWRIELMQLVISNINASESEVLKMMVNRNSRLHKHLVKMYKASSRDVATSLMELCNRFVQYAQQYNHVNLNIALEVIKKNQASLNNASEVINKKKAS